MIIGMEAKREKWQQCGVEVKAVDRDRWTTATLLSFLKVSAVGEAETFGLDLVPGQEIERRHSNAVDWKR